MWNVCPRRSSLLLLLVASVALAREPDEKRVVRTLLVSEQPADTTHNVYVASQVATVLRFEQDVDLTRTKLLGWEGRFAPLLVGSQKVVLEPRRELGDDERVPLLVTLADGTELAFLVRPPSRERWGWTDYQVNVFKNRESYSAVLSSLGDALRRESELREENERLRREETSVDHALATLLVAGQVKKTPFRKEQTAILKTGDMDIIVKVFSGPGKAAVVVQLTNTDPTQLWRFRDARLTADQTPSTARPFALRMDRAELVPGQSGSIAVVADRSAFESEEGLVDLAFEIFREDGFQQVVVRVEHTLLRK